jgi:transcriptional regulator with XRE-family HTH domain
MSNMKEAPDLNQRIAARMQQLRASASLSLDALARKSGVSRSMISLIERAETSPTAVVLEKLALSLGVPLSSLFDAPVSRKKFSPLSRRRDQPEWKDPGSGYTRRNVSPGGVTPGMHIVEVEFPPGARVGFETAARDLRIQQQIWILEGTMEITLGAQCHRLNKGDCFAMKLDSPTMFHNPTRKVARYAVFIMSETPSRRPAKNGNQD